MTTFGEALLQRLDKIIELLDQKKKCDHVWETHKDQIITYWTNNRQCYRCEKCGEYVDLIV